MAVSNVMPGEHKFTLSSKEMVLITKALRGKYSEEDAPGMMALLAKLLKDKPDMMSATGKSP